MSIIYLLSDPRTHAVRYVGQTSKGAGTRLRQHINEADSRKTHVACWIRSLRAEGHCPLVHVVEYGITDANLLDALEKAWITYGREYGWDLTNNAVGGRVNRGFRATEETRRKLSEAHRGKKPTEETRQKMIQARQGRSVHTPESREAIGAAHKGKIVSEETRQRMSESARKRDPATRVGGGRPVGYRHTEESKQRMRDAIRARRTA